MLTTYTRQKFHLITSRRMSSAFWKVFGAFIKSKCVYFDSYIPVWLISAVLCLSHSKIGIRQRPSLQSKIEKYCAVPMLSKSIQFVEEDSCRERVRRWDFGGLYRSKAISQALKRGRPAMPIMHESAQWYLSVLGIWCFRQLNSDILGLPDMAAITKRERLYLNQYSFWLFYFAEMSLPNRRKRHQSFAHDVLLVIRKLW